MNMKSPVFSHPCLLHEALLCPACPMLPMCHNCHMCPNCSMCCACNFCHFSYFYRTQVYLESDLWVRMSVTTRPCWDLTDVTLADEDNNSTDEAKRAIIGNVAMQVTQPGGQLCKKKALIYLETYSSLPIWIIFKCLTHGLEDESNKCLRIS